MFQVIAKLEGPAVSQYCALRLLQVETSSRIKKKKKNYKFRFQTLFFPLFCFIVFL